jgi:plastocyanin
MSSHTTAILILALLAAAVPAGAGSLEGTVKAPSGRGAADAVVYVGAIPGKTFPPPSAHPVVDQREMVFTPHVLVVLVGTTVDFLNSDPLLHNVFSPDKCAEKFNLGSWPQGQMRSYTFEQPCAATLLCNVHPEMEAFVVAVPTPYFTVTGKDGGYAIAEVPDGAYTIKVWHPKLKEASREVTVAGATTADFELKK